MENEKDHYLSELYSSLKYSHSTFDKYIIYIASGALGVFLSISEKILPISNAHHKCFLFTSFYLLGITIILGLIAHYISASLISKCIKEYDINDLTKFDELTKKSNTYIKCINITTIITLVLGLFLFVIYLQLNLS